VRGNGLVETELYNDMIEVKAVCFDEPLLHEMLQFFIQAGCQLPDRVSFLCSQLLIEELSQPSHHRS
jgi:hypothetical protein